MPLTEKPNMSSSSSSSVWLQQYMKLKFFTRIRRLLRSKASPKRNISPLIASSSNDSHREEQPRNRDGFCRDEENQSNGDREEKIINRDGYCPDKEENRKRDCPDEEKQKNLDREEKSRCSVSEKQRNGDREEKSRCSVSEKQRNGDREEKFRCSVSEKQRNSIVEEDDNGPMALRRAVKRLNFGNGEEKEEAAIEIEKMARDDARIKKVVAELGVVKVLVSMAAAEETEAVSRRSAAVRALIQLAHGTSTNKALMMEAGIYTKLPKNVQDLDESSRKEFSELLLSLSSLPNAQFPVASTGILPFLIGVLDSNSSLETKNTCLSTVHNISLVFENSGPLVSNGAIQTLVRLISSKELSEKTLATLSQLVVTQMGKKAMEDCTLVPEGFIEVLTWEDRPKCKEMSAYILMILAHQSSNQRIKMAKAGIVSVLLQLVLLGTPLAEKRAVKLLQWFKNERYERVGYHSGPQAGIASPMGSPMSLRPNAEGKRVMKSLVKQSLYKNMEMITRRATVNVEGEASRLKGLVISTSSKSLPY